MTLALKPVAGNATVIPRVRSRGNPSRKRRAREYGIFLLFALPNFVIIAVFAYWPVIYNFYLSLTQWDLIAPEPLFIGLENFRQLFTSSSFLNTLGITVVFTVSVVIGSIVLGLLVATLLSRPLKGRGLARTLVFAPYVLPGAAVATIWLMMFDPHYGLSRFVFELFGASSPSWMSDSDWALGGLVLVYLWKTIGFCTIVYISAMAGLPSEPYEAASLDGASKVRQFFTLTITFLSPTTFFLLVISVIGTFQAFDIIAVMTSGGPAGSTTTLSWYIYQQGFTVFNIGYSAAGSVVMFFVLITLTSVQSYFFGKRVHYQ